MKKIISYLLLALCFLVSCNSKSDRAEEALQDYERLADEIVEARQNNDYKRALELTVELKSMEAKYSDIKADRDFNDSQRERLAVVMQKIIGGGYEGLLNLSTVENKDSNVANDSYSSTIDTPQVCGVYVVDDGRGSVLYITAKADGTAQMCHKDYYGKDNGQFYGTWTYFDGRNNAASFSFEDDHYTSPNLGFNFDFDNPKTSTANIVIADGYCYYDYQAAKSKNADLRITANKIE